MTAPPSRTWAILVATLLCAAIAGSSAWGHWRRCQTDAPVDAADAVPLYLPGLALREGADPTDAAVISRLMAREAGSGARAQVLSTLYPPSMAPPMAALVGSGWKVFLVRWRALVLGGLLLGCAAAGWGGARGPWAPLAAAAGAVVAVTLFPLTGHALALGQANLLIVGLLGAATWAAARDRAGLAAAFASLGVAVKLVPGLALWPLFAARRWTALAVALSVGVVVTAVTIAWIPPARVVANLVDTIRFQQGVVPAWMTLFPGPLLPFLGVFRFAPLGVVTLVLTGLCAHATRDSAARPAVMASGIALGAAWLGAAASAVGVYYGLLLLPAVIRLSVWPLGAGAPRWTWLFAPVALLPSLVVTADDGVRLASFQMFVVGLAVWVLSAVQLVHTSRDALDRRTGGAMGATVALAIAFSAFEVARAPAFPTDLPGAALQPVGAPAGQPGTVGPAGPPSPPR